MFYRFNRLIVPITFSLAMINMVISPSIFASEEKCDVEFGWLHVNELDDTQATAFFDALSEHQKRTNQPPEKSRADLENLRKGNLDKFGIFARKGETLIGGAIFHIDSYPDDSQSTQTMELFYFAIHPDYRRQGFGTAIFYGDEGLVYLAKKAKLKAIVLKVRKSNTGAQDFFKELGFKEKEGRDEIERYYKNPEETAVVLELPITELLQAPAKKVRTEPIVRQAQELIDNTVYVLEIKPNQPVRLGAERFR